MSSQQILKLGNESHAAQNFAQDPLVIYVLVLLY